MNLDDVVKLIRGKRGTVVRLKVLRAGSVEPREIPITRAEIELKDSEARSEIMEWGRKADGTPYRVGIINLPSFYMDMSGARDGNNNFKSTTRDVAKLLQEFNEAGRSVRGRSSQQRRWFADRIDQPDRVVYRRGPGRTG
jgi:carboxyl-terminal processing protease